MTDKEIIKALECCVSADNCSKCPYYPNKYCTLDMKHDARDLINRQQAEIDRLELVLLGVMHFVDKWLDDVELEQDEINRASTMREKTLQIVEQQQSEIDRLKNENEILSINADTAFQDGLNEAQDLYAEQIKDEIKSEAIKEYKEKLTYVIVNTPTPKPQYKEALSYFDGANNKQYQIIDIINGFEEKEMGNT